MQKQILYYLWLGLSLNTMFFYPLISSLSDNPIYLHWNHTNSVEYILVSCIISIIAAIIIFISYRINFSYIRCFLILMLSAIPLSSFFLYLLWKLEVSQLLKNTFQIYFGDYLYIYGFLLLIIFIITFLIIKYPLKIIKFTIGVILVISPLSVFAFITIISISIKDPTIEIRNDLLSPYSGSIDNNIIVFVFDELDYKYLFSDGVVKSVYKNIKAFSEISDNYHEAYAPGGNTLESMPGFLIGKKISKVDDTKGLQLFEILEDGHKKQIRFSDGNIFLLAKHNGYMTIMYGWLFPYCMLMHDYLDACHSFSIYNFASVNTHPSLINPIFTNILLTPHRIPVGFIKFWIYPYFQHETVSQTYKLAIDTLSIDHPKFMILHFSIPHLPFVYNENKYSPPANPWLQNDENYENQLKYVDYLFGNFINHLQNNNKFENSDIILTSDHSYRIKTKEGSTRRIPIIRKKINSKVRDDIYKSVGSEEVLKITLESN